MAEVCSWCGGLIAEPDAKIDFICRKCGEERRSHHQVPVSPRAWKSWMPEDSYPALDKTDTRKI